VLGRPIEFDDAKVDRVLSARHFVEVRKTAGGPALSEISRALTQSRALLDSDRQWQSNVRNKLQCADERLTEAAKAL
jgi:hypothetical protein